MKTIKLTGNIFCLEPPDLLPLSFGREVMDEGSLAQVSCIAAKGDEPLSLSWTFHGSKISSDLGIIITPIGSKSINATYFKC